VYRPRPWFLPTVLGLLVLVVLVGALLR